MFFGWFCVSPERQRFFSLQLPDRLCGDITHISISMYASPLPSLDICHDHWTLARQATWQHLFTGLPAIIYCTSIGKHLWAASLDTAHSLCTEVHDVCSPQYNRSAQRNMKCGHPSTQEVSLSSNPILVFRAVSRAVFRASGTTVLASADDW